MQSYNANDIIEYHDIFNPTDHASILKYTELDRWKWGHSSNPGKDKIPPFWIMDLSNEKFFNEYLLKKIENVTNAKYDLERVYANGHTYGMRGKPHVDGYTDNCRTFLYYPMKGWDVQWGGKTTFIIPTETGNKYHYVIPEPNKGVIFPGQIYHWAEETTRSFGGIRITIAWKLFRKQS
jgi:hypothetical protein